MSRAPNVPVVHSKTAPVRANDRDGSQLLQLHASLELPQKLIPRQQEVAPQPPNGAANSEFVAPAGVTAAVAAATAATAVAAAVLDAIGRRPTTRPSGRRRGAAHDRIRALLTEICGGDGALWSIVCVGRCACWRASGRPMSNGRSTQCRAASESMQERLREVRPELYVEQQLQDDDDGAAVRGRRVSRLSRRRGIKDARGRRAGVRGWARLCMFMCL